MMRARGRARGRARRNGDDQGSPPRRPGEAELASQQQQQPPPGLPPPLQVPQTGQCQSAVSPLGRGRSMNGQDNGQGNGQGRNGHPSIGRGQLQRSQMGPNYPSPGQPGRGQPQATGLPRLPSAAAAAVTAPTVPPSGTELRRSVGPPAEAMGAMSLEPRNGGNADRELGVSVRTSVRGRRRGVDEYRSVLTRPEHAINKQGKLATGENRVTLISNHAEVRWMNSQTWFQYHVDFQPELELRSWKTSLMSAHRNTVLDCDYVFNGMTLFMRRQLQDNPTQLLSNHPKDQSPVRIMITLTATLLSSSPEALHLANLALRNDFREQDWVLIGRNYFNMNKKWSVPQHGLEVVSGFTTSILEFEDGLQLQVDLSHKLIRTITVLEMIDDIYQQCRRNPSVLPDRLGKNLIGSVVITRYNQKTYRVNEIRLDLDPSHEFTTRDGRMSIAQYYSQAYGCVDLNMNQPLLSMVVSKKQQRQGITEILIPPSLLMLTGYTDEMRSNFRMMKEVSNYTKIGPVQRFQRLNQFVDSLSRPPAEGSSRGGLAQKGLVVAPRLLEVEGRCLLPATLLMKSDESLKIESSAEWTNSMKGQPILADVELARWLLVFPSVCRQLANTLCRMMMDVCRSAGIRLNQPAWIEMPDYRTSTYITFIRDNIANMQMVVVILKETNKTTYDAIKKLTCVESPVPSQCVREKTLLNMNKSIATKLSLQMQCKLGGELWRVKFPKMPGKLMIVGIDTYHDSVHRGSSVMGMVASLNESATRYVSQTCHQGAHAEIGNHMDMMITKSLRVFAARNGQLPDIIFVYRDGVGDGMLEMVVEFEQDVIRKQLTSLENEFDHKFQLVFIVVKKRIHNRFFLKNGRGGTITNPLPGTVIDSRVTRPHWYDFFLISQSVRQGSVSPTHYNIICDEAKWPPDRVQKLTYWLTHLYYNWQGTVAVPAPCQYAHKIAYQVGQVLHQSANQKLQETLWFL